MSNNAHPYPAAVVIPSNLTGKILKVVTKDFADGSQASFRPLREKNYDDNTNVLVIIKDIVEALGGTYTELD